MAKSKKKEGKKADKLKGENSEECTPKVSSTSTTELQASSTSVCSNIPVRKENPPIRVPDPEVYEEPDLAQYFVDKYEGEIMHGLYEGEGVAYFINGNIYSGNFTEGILNGKGKYTWADGTTYEGEFSMNSATGHGIFIWPNGNRYEGKVRNGIRHGTGTLTASDRQSTYTGEWQNGLRHGKGKIYYDEEGTSWYEGEWVNDKKDGWGMQRFKSGNIYEGQWKNNKCHGLGRMRWIATKEEYTGQWVNGIQNGYGAYIWLIQRDPETKYSMRDVNIGNFVNATRHGKGQFNYADGSVYDGEWKSNIKHGTAKFVSLAGQNFVGEFMEDRMVGFENNPGFLGVRRKRPNTPGIPILPNDTPSLLDTFMELDLSPLLENLTETERNQEIRKAESIVLQNVKRLQKMYRYYSSLAKENLDNTFLMTKLQFWRFLKDCKLHHYKLSLSEIDRILFDNADPEEVHSPFETMLLRTFLSKLINLSYHICHLEDPDITPAEGFSRIMQNNILPNAEHVKGYLFNDLEKTAHAMSYIDKCWEIYKNKRHQNATPPYDPTMKMRNFLWMLDDLKITGKDLNVKSVVDVLGDDNPSVNTGDDITVELEITFLEFFEALLGCADICVTDDMVNECTNTGSLTKEQESDDIVSRIAADITERAPKLPPEGQSLRNAWKFTGKGQTQPVTFHCKKKTDLDVRTDTWFIKIDIFFMKIFFPAYEHMENLKVEILKIREQEEERARILQIEEEERLRLKALKEEEEAKLKAELEAEKARALLAEMQLAKELAEEEKNAQPPAPPKEPLAATAPQSTKATPASKKKKKAA
ncbi:radial spoke head 10 homolog B [Discoglossus pictus]